MPPPPDGPPAQALALVHEGWDHLRRERPLAAWASWQRALRIDPDQLAAKQALDRLANAADLPASARQEYRFRAPTDPDRRARWDTAFRGRDLSDLDEAAAAFAALAEEDPTDPDAPYNQGLCLAWLGRNQEAVWTLDKSARRQAESDFESTVRTRLLSLILSASPPADVTLQWSNESIELDGVDDPVAALDEIGRRVNLRRIPSPVDPSVDPSRAGVITAEILDRPWPDPGKSPLTLDDVPRVDAVVIATGDRLRFSWLRQDGRQAVQMLLEAIGGPKLDLVGQFYPPDVRRAALPLALLDAPVWTIRLPDWVDPETRRRLYRENAEDFFDNGRTVSKHGMIIPADRPLESAGSEAWIRLYEELAARPSSEPLYQGYPFDRIRHRKGLAPRDPASIDPIEISFMTAAELGDLDPSALDDRDLAAALRAALPLYDDVIARFAGPAIERRLPVLAHLDLVEVVSSLIFPAFEANRLDEVDRILVRAIEIDEAMHGGRNRDHFEFWRAEILAVRGHPDEALALFVAILRRGRSSEEFQDGLQHDGGPYLALLNAGHPEHARQFLIREIEIVRERGDVDEARFLEKVLRDHGNTIAARYSS